MLVARAQCGDVGSLNRVLQEIQEPLYRHIRSVAAEADDAKDVLQNALWTIARKLTQLQDPRLFRAWAYRIATRIALRSAKRERMWLEALRGEALTALPDPSGEVDDTVIDGHEVRALLATAGGASGVVMRMYYLDELSYAEIAEVLDIPLGTVKSRIAYGMAGLRRRARSGPT